MYQSGTEGKFLYVRIYQSLKIATEKKMESASPEEITTSSYTSESEEMLLVNVSDGQ